MGEQISFQGANFLGFQTHLNPSFVSLFDMVRLISGAK